MLEKLNWPTALVMTAVVLVIGGCVMTGHHLPAAVVGALGTVAAGAMERLFAKPGAS